MNWTWWTGPSTDRLAELDWTLRAPRQMYLHSRGFISGSKRCQTWSESKLFHLIVLNNSSLSIKTIMLSLWGSLTVKTHHFILIFSRFKNILYIFIWLWHSVVTSVYLYICIYHSRQPFPIYLFIYYEKMKKKNWRAITEKNQRSFL